MAVAASSRLFAPVASHSVINSEPLPCPKFRRAHSETDLKAMVSRTTQETSLRSSNGLETQKNCNNLEGQLSGKICLTRHASLPSIVDTFSELGCVSTSFVSGKAPMCRISALEELEMPSVSGRESLSTTQKREVNKYGLSEQIGGFGDGGNGGYGHGRGDDGFGDNADAYYRKSISDNPGEGLLLRNYAKFLYEVKQDYCRAEEFYGRAILANPGEGEILADYGKLIWETYGDEDRAGDYFDQAVEAAPDDSHVLGAYAAFAWSCQEREKTESLVGMVAA